MIAPGAISPALEGEIDVGFEGFWVRAEGRGRRGGGGDCKECCLE